MEVMIALLIALASSSGLTDARRLCDIKTPAIPATRCMETRTMMTTHVATVICPVNPKTVYTRIYSTAPIATYLKLSNLNGGNDDLQLHAPGRWASNYPEGEEVRATVTEQASVVCLQVVRR